MKKTILCLIMLFSSHLYCETSPTHLYLIRNGATPRNVEGIVQGQEEVPDSQLNDEGRQHGEQVGKLLSESHPNISTTFYTSPLGRAKDTATIAANYFNNVSIVIKDDLKEISHGKHDGMDKNLRNKFFKQYFDREIAKYKSKYPDQSLDPYFKWKENPLAGAETCFQMCQRAINALIEIGQENPGQEVAVFSHGALIETLITNYHYSGNDAILPFYFEEKCIPNGSIAHFYYNPNAEEKLQYMGIENLNP